LSPVANASGHSNGQPPEIETVGVILVHGVGEQRRYEHLSGETRNLLDALRALANATPGAQIDVEIMSGQQSSYLADQDTWEGGAAVRVIARGLAPKEIHFHFHEVWWGDVNETYSLAKQFRFWLWGLSVWRYPEKTASTLASAQYVAPPIRPRGSWSTPWIRARLFGVSAVFTLLGFSIGTVSFLLKRLFDLDAPALLVTITNYVSGIKLYNQRRRFGSGLIPNDDEFLDAIGEPPRVSIRRRMIRTIAEVACSDYERWYVFAHSLGSIAAFNGLMETDWAWPGYLSEARWNALLNHSPPLAGAPRRDWNIDDGKTVPARPTWAGNNVAYRRRIFERFRGLVTYGSPLEKFAAIWPARVPISRTRGFAQGTEWINVFDPIDPVSGVLKSFSAQPEHCCPRPQNVGYAASPILLLSHIRYFTPKGLRPDLATSVARWLLGAAGVPGSKNNTFGTYQFQPGMPRAGIRSAAAWTMWIATFLLLAALGGVVFPLFVKAVAAAGSAVWQAISHLFFRERPPSSGWSSI